MEADWAAEIGVDLPEIVVPWADFVDLVRMPDRIAEMEEVKSHSALGEALAALNSKTSPVFTSKCDVWLWNGDEMDPFEFDADAEDVRSGTACYIDLLHRNPRVFASFTAHEAWARRLTSVFCGSDVSPGRVDLVVRAAQVEARDGFGLTLYAAGCGQDEAAAQTCWEAVLRMAVEATISDESAGE